MHFFWIYYRISVVPRLLLHERPSKQDPSVVPQEHINELQALKTEAEKALEAEGGGAAALVTAAEGAAGSVLTSSHLYMTTILRLLILGSCKNIS